MMRLSAHAAYWAGHIQSRAASDAPTFLLCALLLFSVWGMRRPAAEKALAVKITFFDGTDSARYEVRDAADFDPHVLLEVHHQFYGHATSASANTDTDEE